MDTQERAINFYKRMNFVEYSGFKLHFAMMKEEFRGMYRTIKTRDQG